MDVSIKTCRLSVGPARRWDTLLSSLILLSLRSGSEISKGCCFFFFLLVRPLSFPSMKFLLKEA